MTEQIISTISTEQKLVTRSEWQASISRRRQVGDVALRELIHPVGILDVEDIDVAYEAVEMLLSSEISPEYEAMDRHVKELRKTESVRIAAEYSGGDFEMDIRHQILEDSRLQNFLRERTLDDALERLVSAWPDVERAFIAGMVGGIEQGYIPKESMERLEDALKATSIKLVDPIVASVMGHEATYQDAKDEIEIADCDSLMECLLHEFTHKVSGGSFESTLGNDGARVRRRGGFSNLTDAGYSKIGIDEALTQHITKCLVDGDFETMDPDARTVKDRVYYPYRKTVAAFIDRSGGKVTTKKFITAYFEDSGPGGGTLARRELIASANEAYGPGALNALEELMDQCGQLDDFEYEEIFKDLILGAIHPPILNQEGGVKRRGYIDIGSVQAHVERRVLELEEILRRIVLTECS